MGHSGPMTISPARVRAIAALLALALLAAACGSDDDTSDATTDDDATTSEDGAAAGDPDDTDGEAGDDAMAEGGHGADLAGRTSVAEGAQWGDNVTITIEGETMVFESDGLPSHEYLEVYLGDGQNGKFVGEPVTGYDARFEIPLVPTMLDAPVETPNGSIGVAISGAVFFDPFEGDGSGTVANDDNEVIDGIPFIDACGGHTIPDGTTYHYHGVPLCITDAIDALGEHSALIGYLFDGVPIYGPQDVDGEAPTDLDACLGHVGPTPEFDEDVYHYHTSLTPNYISECFAAEAVSAGGPPGRN